MLIGFPVAAFFSWRFDLTTSGIRRTPAAHEDVAQGHSLTQLDYGVLASLGLVVLVTVFGVGQHLIDVQIETARAPETRVIDPHSIAVLPLENLSPNPGNAYFAAGVHDSLITSLSRISTLMVTSRTSARRVDPELSVPEIGRQLGVAKLLDGSVLMDGDRVRIVVQLIDAASDLNLWADTFESDVSDVITLQNEMAQSIADVIEVRLTPREEAALAQAPKVRPDTYRGYLKGMYQFRQASPESAWRGIGILEEVVRKDPDSALAHAGLAYGYADEDALRLAKEAIRVDPEHWAGWLSLGTIYAQLGQFDEAIDAHEKLVGTIYEAAIGTTYAIAGIEDKALRVAAALEDIPGTELLLAWIYMNLGDHDSALHWIAAMEAVKAPWYPAFLGMYHGSELLADDPRLQERAAALGLPDPRTMSCGN